jgi:hypothetical protein
LGYQSAVDPFSPPTSEQLLTAETVAILDIARILLLPTYLTAALAYNFLLTAGSSEDLGGQIHVPALRHGCLDLRPALRKSISGE